jgi:hypothetical protein
MERRSILLLTLWEYIEDARTDEYQKQNPLFIFHHTSLKIQFNVFHFLLVLPNVIVLSVYLP